MSELEMKLKYESKTIGRLDIKVNELKEKCDGKDKGESIQALPLLITPHLQFGPSTVELLISQDEQETGSIWLHLEMSNEEETANVALSTLVEVVGHKDSAFASNPVIPLLSEVAKVWPLYLCQKTHVLNMCRLIHIWTSLGK